MQCPSAQLLAGLAIHIAEPRKSVCGLAAVNVVGMVIRVTDRIWLVIQLEGVGVHERQPGRDVGHPASARRGLARLS